MGHPAPTAADLAVLDPDGSFRRRLMEDHARIVVLAAEGTGQLAELGRIVHQLAGAAGTFGFAEIGDLAIVLDDTLIDGAAEANVKPMVARLLAALAAV